MPRLGGEALRGTEWLEIEPLQLPARVTHDVGVTLVEVEEAPGRGLDLGDPNGRLLEGGAKQTGGFG